MTSKEFVHTFTDIWKSTDRRICFVLGAGASKSSGIRTGGELAKQWLDEIKQRMQGQNGAFQDFLEKHSIDENSPAAAYPLIYKDRFKFDADSGFDFINNEMERAKPGYGYSVLAQILSDRQHNIVITTNFDNLTEDALYTFTSKRPLICGHESLAIFAKPSVKRPLIVKIHRDRFFNPQSNPEEIETINKLWVDALNNIFRAATPIFIGYGGNDGSLMGYLEQVSALNNLFWCERKGSVVTAGVESLLNKHNGKLVEIDGFDELMFLLQDGIGLKLLDQEIIEIANTRSKEYKETVENIRNKQSLSDDDETQRAAERIVEKAGDSWWAWELKVQKEKNNEEKERLYKEGLKNLSESPELNGNFAIFLKNIRKNYDEAEKYYRKALEIEPENANTNGNFAIFLEQTRKNYNEAEKYYRKALEIEPENAKANGNFANFLMNTRNNYDEAEKYYRKALEIEPEYAKANGNLALFLKKVRKNYDEAEKYYRKALEIDMGNANTNGNFAIFLEDIRKNYDEAEKYYRKALEIEPEHALNNGNFANFLKDIRKNYDEAEKYYRKALEIEPEHAIINGNFAGLLMSIGKIKDAQTYWSKAFQKNPPDELLSELWFYKYAHVEEERQTAFEQLKVLLCEKRIRSIGFSMQNNVDYAVNNGHPNPKLLQEIADIITNDASTDGFCKK